MNVGHIMNERSRSKILEYIKVSLKRKQQQNMNFFPSLDAHQ